MVKERPRPTITGATQGTEIEAVLDSRGKPYPLDNRHFQRLAKLLKSEDFHTSDLNGQVYKIGVMSELGQHTLDAARSLPEINISPVGVEDGGEGLKELSEKQSRALMLLNQVVREIAKDEKAGTLSLSMHPLGRTDMQTYGALVTPKAIYSLLWEWGWDHASGIHAAHTSPWTSIDVHQAADALAVMIGSSAAQIAVFGN
jgi:hypothetical protein